MSFGSRSTRGMSGAHERDRREGRPRNSARSHGSAVNRCRVRAGPDGGCAGGRKAGFSVHEKEVAPSGRRHRESQGAEAWLAETGPWRARPCAGVHLPVVVDPHSDEGPAARWDRWCSGVCRWGHPVRASLHLLLVPTVQLRGSVDQRADGSRVSRACADGDGDDRARPARGCVCSRDPAGGGSEPCFALGWSDVARGDRRLDLGSPVLSDGLPVDGAELQGHDARDVDVRVASDHCCGTGAFSRSVPRRVPALRDHDGCGLHGLRSRIRDRHPGPRAERHAVGGNLRAHHRLRTHGVVRRPGGYRDTPLPSALGCLGNP